MKKTILAFIIGIFLFLSFGNLNVFGQQAEPTIPAGCIDSHNTNGFDACVASGDYKVCSSTATAAIKGAIYCCSGVKSCPNSSTSVTISGAGSLITCADGKSVNTAIGCIPINDQNALVGFLLRWGIGIGGGIAFLLILVAGFQIM